MAKKSKSGKKPTDAIAVNKKAKFDYTIEEYFEAGIVLQGWEIKSLREGKAQIADSYVIVKRGEVFLIGAVIAPLLSASTHVKPEDNRTRKLLLHKKEIKTLIGKVEQRGYALVPTKLYWKQNRVKLEFGLAKGKKMHDKRKTIKERDWNRDKHRILKK